MSGGASIQKHWIAARAIGAEYGFELVNGSGGHAKLVRPGHRPVPVSSSPRDDRNMLTRIRRQLAASVRAAEQR
jgi:hypothetical protein